MIEAVFLSRFHPEKGPVVTHQIPDNAVLPGPRAQPASAAPPPPPLFDFYALADYIIPRQEFCDAPLAIASSGRRIVGHPVCITSPRYARNEFIFNLALVLPDAADPTPYARVARRVAQLLRDAELADGFLSADEARLDAPPALALDAPAASPAPAPAPPPASRVHALCEMLMQDLNSYGEAMVAVDGARTLNVALRGAGPPAPAVRAWHVPVAARALGALVREPGWDLAVAAVARWVDGRRSVAQIAGCADADVAVARRGVACLAGAGLVRLVDVFQYGAVYAPAPRVRRVLLERGAQERAARAVAEEGATVDADKVAGLYVSLGHGLSLKNWCLEHWRELDGIDVRRFIVWGLLEGYLYRVHKYAIAEEEHGVQDGPARTLRTDGHSIKHGDLPLGRYLDGLHCFDSICTAHQISQQELTTRLKDAYNVHIIEK